jgi:CelD/BcsL family acetyltransferase involved in cellulose biosynthesis
MDEWARLHDDEATPFMHPAWARAWWKHYGDGAEPYLVQAGGALGAFAMRRRGGQRILGPWGSEPGDYWDVLGPPQGAEEVAEMLMARRRDWDAVVIGCTHPDSAFGQAMRDAGAIIPFDRAIPSPAIELPESFDEYLGGLSASRRSNIRRHLKRLDSGEIALRELRDPAELRTTFDRWQRLRVAQWAATDRVMNPEHASQRFRDFLCEAARDLLPSGQALIWEFSVDGEVVGVYLNFADAHSFYWYLGGFDMKVASLGLGKIAIAHGIRTSIEAGRRRFDFGRGAEPYKYWYGAKDRSVRGLIVGTPRPRSRLVVAGGAFAAEHGHAIRARREA